MDNAVFVLFFSPLSFLFIFSCGFKQLRNASISLLLIFLFSLVCLMGRDLRILWKMRKKYKLIKS